MAKAKKTETNRTKPLTAGYEPLHYSFASRPRDLPPFTFALAQSMLMDPTVRLGLAMRAAPLYGVEFAYKQGDEWTPGVEALKPEVGHYIYRQLKKIWQSLDAVAGSQIWGWSGGEITYRLSRYKMVEIDRLLPRHALDVKARTAGEGVCGVRVERCKNGNVDLDYPRCWFHSHMPSDGRVYGDSALLGCYSPWADKWLNGGALDVRRLFMHKDAYAGGDMTFPEGVTEIEGKGTIPNRDIARELIEQLVAGGVTARPAEFDEKGNELWKLTRATVASNPGHILQYPKDLDTEILRGLEIPDDVLTAESSGAWAGKQVPMQAFYCGLDRWARCMVGDMQPILEALVMLNFGRAEEFGIAFIPLAEQAMELQQKQQPQQGQQSRPPQRDDDSGSPFQMSLEQAVGRGIVRLSTDDPKPKSEGRWITIGGTKDGGVEHRGGFKIQIDDDGHILKGGPRGIRGMHVSQIGEYFDSEQHARDQDESERHAIESGYYDQADEPLDESDAPGRTKSWKRIVAYQAASWDMDKDTYESIADQVWRDKAERENTLESARARARKRLGVTAADINRLENQGFDSGSKHAKIKHFDDVGRSLAGEFPELGWGRGYEDDQGVDHAEKVWELVRTGKQAAPSRTSREYHSEVDAYLQSELRRYGSSYRMALRMGGLFDEDEHPRAKNGEFTKGRSAAAAKHGTKAKSMYGPGQKSLFSKRGLLGQKNLFDDVGVPDDMVLKGEDAKPASKGNLLKDESGSPIVMYRGVKGDSLSQYGGKQSDNMVFVTPNKGLADRYASQFSDGKTHAVNVNADNVIDIGKGEGYQLWKRYKEETSAPSYASSGTDDGMAVAWTHVPEFRKWLDANGIPYDGIYVAENDRSRSLAVKSEDQLLPPESPVSDTKSPADPENAYDSDYATRKAKAESDYKAAREAAIEAHGTDRFDSAKAAMSDAKFELTRLDVEETRRIHAESFVKGGHELPAELAESFPDLAKPEVSETQKSVKAKKPSPTKGVTAVVTNPFHRKHDTGDSTKSVKGDIIKLESAPNVTAFVYKDEHGFYRVVEKTTGQGFGSKASKKRGEAIQDAESKLAKIDKDFLTQAIANGKVLNPNDTEPPKRMSAAHAPKGGVSIGGDDYKGGEFVPGHSQEEVDEAAEGGKSKKSGEHSTPAVRAWAAKKFKDPEHAKAFTKWFGDSKVVDENGEPLVVYHGTSGDFDEFSTDMVGSVGDPRAKRESTFFFTNRSMVAASYATTQGKDEGVGRFGSGDYQSAEELPVAMIVNKGGEWQEVPAGNKPPKGAMYGVRDESGGFRGMLYADSVKSEDEFRQKAWNKIKDGPAYKVGANVIAGHMSLQNPLVIDADGNHYNAVVPQAIDQARKNGHDGVIVKRVRDIGGHGDAIKGTATTYVALSPNQIKSATGNRGTFDPASRKITMSADATGHEHKGKGAGGGQFTGHGGGFSGLSDGERSRVENLAGTGGPIKDPAKVKASIAKITSDKELRKSIFEYVEKQRSGRESAEPKVAKDHREWEATQANHRQFQATRAAIGKSLESAGMAKEGDTGESSYFTAENGRRIRISDHEAIHLRSSRGVEVQYVGRPLLDTDGTVTRKWSKYTRTRGEAEPWKIERIDAKELELDAANEAGRVTGMPSRSAKMSATAEHLRAPKGRERNGKGAGGKRSHAIR